MDKILVLTVVAQVLLISIVMVIMGRRRFAAARNKEIHLSAFRTMDLAGANEGVITASRNFDNQFQMPMLFIFAVLFALHFGMGRFGICVIGQSFCSASVITHCGAHNLQPCETAF